MPVRTVAASGRRPQPLDREQTAAIRAWARQNGQQGLGPRAYLQGRRRRLPGRSLKRRPRAGPGVPLRPLLQICCLTSSHQHIRVCRPRYERRHQSGDQGIAGPLRPGPTALSPAWRLEASTHICVRPSHGQLGSFPSCARRRRGPRLGPRTCFAGAACAGPCTLIRAPTLNHLIGAAASMFGPDLVPVGGRSQPAAVSAPTSQVD
jgi:hypothetical protein